MLWYLRAVFLSLIYALNFTDAQTICRYNRNINGVCKPMQDCTELHDSVIFPSAMCESKSICCPRDMASTLDKGTQQTQPSPANTEIKPVDDKEYNKLLHAIFNYTDKSPNETETKPNATSQVMPSLTHATLPTNQTFKKITSINLDEERLKGIFKFETTATSPPHSTQMPPADSATEASSEEGNISPHQNVTVATVPIKNTTVDNFDASLNARGVNMLRSQKCGNVHASKNPNGSNIAAEKMEFPWLALLLYKIDGSGEQVFGCGGSLITDRWVLTAAQCIKSNLYRVRLGEYDLQKNSRIDCTQEAFNRTCKDFRIAATLIHPNYNAETKTKDIALIVIQIRAMGLDKNIKPICLPTASELLNTPFNERKLIMAGWRSTTEDGSSTILRKHFVNQQRFVICMVAYPSMNYDTDESKICLAGSDHEQSTCSGDAGGPAFWLAQQNAEEFYVQLAIVPSDMLKCGGTTNLVPYYAERVADSMDWITRVIGEEF